MTPDIIVLGANGLDGTAVQLPAAASPDYTNKPPAANGTCSLLWHCDCAPNGQAGGSGNRGNTGGAGKPGSKAPTLCIIVGRLLSDLAVQTQGGKGGQGAPGSKGTDGGKGQDAGTNVPYCLKDHYFSKAQCPPALGGVGGDAGRGGDGGPGGGGGDGGDIYLYYAESQTISPGGSAYQVFALSTPGDIGLGGGRGAPGNPGLGGLNEVVGGNPQTRQTSGITKDWGDWGLNGSPPGDPGTVLSVMLPPS